MGKVDYDTDDTQSINGITTIRRDDLQKPSFFTHMYVLMWKQFKIQFVRRLYSTLVIMFLPLVFFAVIIYMRSMLGPEGNELINLNETVKDSSINVYLPPFLEPEKSILYYPKNEYTTAIVNRFALKMLGSDFYMHTSYLDYEKMVYAPESMDALDELARATVSGVIAIIFDQSTPVSSSDPIENKTVEEFINNKTLSYTLKFPSNPYCTAFASREYTGASTSQETTVIPYLVDSKCRSENTTWNTKEPFTRAILSFDMPLEDLQEHTYILSGFLYTQIELNRQIYNEVIERAIEEKVESDKNGPGIPSYPNPVIVDMLQRYNYKIQLLPTPQPNSYSFAKVGFAYIFPLLTVLALVYTCIVFTKDIVKEKSDRLKENCKMVGIGGFAYYLHWFLYGCIIFIVPTILGLTIIVVSIKLLFVTSVSIFYALFLLYLVSVIQLCLFISSVFSSPSITSPAVATIFIFLYVPFMVLNNPGTVKLPLALLLSIISPNVCLAFGLTVIGQFETMARPLTWSSLGNAASAELELNIAVILAALIWHIVFWGLCTWYVETVFPGNFGIGQPWHTPFTFIYRMISSKNKTTSDLLDDNIDYSKTHVSDSKRFSTSSYMEIDAMEDLASFNCFEAEPTRYVPGVRVRNLTKIYPNGKLAVDGLTLNMYKNQVTCLLGHNGAGKSTTMSMLTGIYEPSKGDAYYYDNKYSVQHEVSKCRRSLGLCPQTNVLFDELTVREQLYFYGMIKGIPRSEIDAASYEMLKDLKMSEKYNNFPSDLSGGMKRKLCVGLAFIGDPEVVYLDEPTSGMDPSARRATWDLIHKYKVDRTIMLTTHFMDEADVLGDRIAIMANGQLQALGTSSFLKRSFGAGYQLIFTKQQKQDKQEAGISGADGLQQEDATNEQRGKYRTNRQRKAKRETQNTIGNNVGSNDEDEDNLNNKTLVGGVDVESITAMINRYVPGATLWNNVGLELSYKLPITAQSEFPDLFNEIDDNMRNFKLHSYALSCTTLEEVFIKVGELAEQGHAEYESKAAEGTAAGNKDDDNKDYNLKALTNEDPEKQFKIMPAGTGLILQQFYALFMIKRFVSARRNKWVIIFQAVLPIIFTIAAMAITYVSTRPSDEEKVEDTLKFNINLLYEDTNEKFKNDEVFKSTIPTGYIPNFSNSGKGLNSYLPNYSPDHYETVEYDNPNSMNDYLVSKRLDENSRFIYTFKYIGAMQLSRPTEFNPGPTAGISHLNAHVEPTLINLYASTTSEHAIPLINHSLTNAIIAHDLELVYQGLYITPGSVITEFTIPYLKALSETKQVFDANFTPFPEAESENLSGAAVGGSPGFSVAFMSLFGMCFLSSSFALFVVKERQCKSRHLQSIAGVTPLMYWTSTFLFDFAIYLVAMAIIFAIYMISNVAFNVFTDKAETIIALFLILFSYGFCSIQFIYLFQRLFDRPLIAYVISFLFCLFTGFGTSLTLNILRIIGTFQDSSSQTDQYFNIARILNYLFLIFPNFCFSNGISNIADQWNFKETCISTIEKAKLSIAALQQAGVSSVVAGVLADDGSGGTENPGAGALDVVGFLASLDVKDCQNGKINEYYEAFAGIIFMLVNLGIDYQLEIEEYLSNKVLSHRALSGGGNHESAENARQALHLPPPGPLVGEEDSDVTRERELVLTHDLEHRESSSIIMENLTKVYHKEVRSKNENPNFIAVNQLSLGLRKGECFGLLGVNGAGKTTTFSMLTGDSYVQPTFGDAIIEGYSIVRDTASVKRLIGYCPQFDALLPLLTAEETLTMFAMLKGIEPSEIKDAVMGMIRRIDLHKHYTRTCGTYSGGNKRKLSTALALLGNPSVVFLDEPTSGVDAATRRFLWKIISDITAAGNQLVVLTSHSMEECEALCSRLTIMVGGTLRCLGSVQHLKNKYGKGLNVIFRLSEEFSVPETSSKAKNAASNVRIEDHSHLAMSDRISILKEKVQSVFPMIMLTSENLGLVNYELPVDVISNPHDAQTHDSTKYTWSRIFQIVSEIAGVVGAQDYSLSQSTLEQIFIMFARTDELEKEAAMANI